MVEVNTRDLIQICTHAFLEGPFTSSTETPQKHELVHWERYTPNQEEHLAWVVETYSRRKWLIADQKTVVRNGVTDMIIDHQGHAWRLYLSIAGICTDVAISLCVQQLHRH